MSIGTARSTNYVLLEAHSFIRGGETCTLPCGAFVRPIRDVYVPKHVQKETYYFNPTTESYCYTRYGFVLIPNSKIRELS